ncbi:MAG: hypothetical protein ACE5OZ_00330 [Candidatus Heimdallarchaeota archaeon]
MDNGCWNCARAMEERGARIWCAYWKAYFLRHHTGCKPPAFMPLVLEDDNIIEIEEYR